ncbi:rhomboid family intramembrane serine protease [Gammaproteobacteria bacterium AB-CW1]|uniref:Rhomboid family intramembrane serine protease n=1 Tax=Natronospira elongata TaxID=3110268 RepID=A0AAP6JEP9_9GAMM|nr:rhomboid family intramembrane serine protease [Gammaproteobacteria bacterium AB-CW1]
MIPIADNNPTHRTPVVTWVILLACIVVFLWQITLSEQAFRAMVFHLGVVPRALFEVPLGHPDLLIPPLLTLFTSMFLHGGLLHLLGNMLFLYVFANNIEDSMGHGRFIVFYLLCGLAAALTQALMAPDSTVPMVGASGAISGVLGAYLMLHPFAWIKLLVPYFVIFFLWLPAWLMLGLWFAFQLFQSMMTPADQAGVAFAAHAGGFVAGVVLVLFFKRPGVRLFR